MVNFAGDETEFDESPEKVCDAGMLVLGKGLQFGEKLLGEGEIVFSQVHGLSFTFFYTGR